MPLVIKQLNGGDKGPDGNPGPDGKPGSTEVTFDFEEIHTQSLTMVANVFYDTNFDIPAAGKAVYFLEFVNLDGVGRHQLSEAI